MRSSRVVFILLCLVGSGLVGCGRDAPSTASSTDAASDAAVAPDASPDAALASLPVEPAAPAGPTAESLAPRIAAAGPTGVVPDEVSVTFATQVVEGARAVDGDDVERTVLEVQPPTAGTLEYVNPTTLVFRPAEGFRPGTTYTVALRAVKTDRGVVRPLVPWTHTFTTPGFGFVEISPRARAFDRQEATLDVVFSAPVQAHDLARFATWTVEGRAVAHRPVYKPGNRGNVIEVTLRHPHLRPMSQVKLALAPGVPSGTMLAEGGEASLRLTDGPAVEILKVRPRESATGFYIDVICHDAGNGTRRYFWDRHEYESYRISRRCELDPEDARARLSFNPPVDFRVAPSGGGFRLLGDFERGKYSLRIEAGAKSVDGGHVGATFTQELDIPARSARVRFVSEGRYLPRNAWSNLPIKHLNVDQLELTVRHVPRRNLVFWMSAPNERADARVADLVRTVDIPVRGDVDVEDTSWVDVASVIPAPQPGVYELTVGARGETDVRRLLITDLHLVVKRGQPGPGEKWSRQVWAWALDAHTGRPVPGVDVALLRPSGKKMANCTTRGSKGCQLEVPAKDVDPEPPFAIIATKGKDFTYLKYSELETEHPDDPVHGAPYRDERPYGLAVYTDRGVYRPGETAHLVAVVRDGDHLAPPEGLPVELVLHDPRQKVARKRVQATNLAGLVSFDLPFADFAPTGSWTAELRVGTKTLAHHRFNVEAFVPERMKVEAAPAKAALLEGDEAAFDVSARYLFGGSAADSEVTLTCRLVPAPFRPKHNRDYRFGPADSQGSGSGGRAVDLGTVSGSLDDEGKARLTCPLLDGEQGLAGAAGRVVAQAAVFEAGSGRTSQVSARAIVHPSLHYVGLKTAAKKAVPGETFSVEGLVADWDGKPVTDAAGAVDVELVRLRGEYGWYYDERLDRETWKREVRRIPEGTLSAKVEKGRFRFEVTPKDAGDGFLVRVKSDGALTELRLKGTWHDYAWWSPRERRSDRTRRPSRPTALVLDLPESVELKRKLPVRFEAPYRGQALVTLETDRVVDTRWIAVEPGSNRTTFSLKAFAPNVYVSVFLMKDPHLESKEAFLPDRAFGTRSVRIVPTAYTQKVALKVPEEVRPHDTLEIELDLGPLDEPTFATVAAVDQGILSLTRFRTPDPIADLFARRALGVETFDTIGWALKLAAGGPSSSTGGDDEMGQGAIMPVKPVALWSGVVEVPESGKATVRFAVPQYRGELRVMAVTAGSKRVGRAEATVKVRDPLVLQTTLPRFLVGDDQVEIPVFVTNLSGKARTVTVALEAEELPVPGLKAEASAGTPPLELKGPATQTLKLAEGESGTVVFTAIARRLVGAAELKVSARSGDLLSHDSLEVPFLPAGPRERVVQQVPLSSGAIDLKPYLEGWVPTSERTNVWVTNVEHAEAFDHLSFLVRYPYGCVEQTTTSTRPLLFVRYFVERVAPDVVARAGGVDKMVRHGIDRVLSMQTPEGGLGYWPGATHPNAWGTAYATHMLLDARDQGYHVPQDRLEAIFGWIERAVDEKNTRYRHADAYLHYVLARARRGRKGQVQRLIDALPSPLREHEAERAYLLKAALWLAGDRRYEDALKDLDAAAPSDVRHTGGSFYSARRRKGLVLSTFIDLFGNDPLAKPLTETVARSLRGAKSRSYTTQELVWGVTGLGKWIHAEAGDFTPPDLRVDGKTRAPQPSDRPDKSWLLPRASERGALTLEVPADAPENLRLVLASEGIRADGEMRTGGEGLLVEREYLDADGAPIDPESLELGEMVYTRVSIANTHGQALENLALVDRFPAGWEVENPRLGRGQLPDWVDADALWGLEHMNIRDDRIEVFGGLGKGDTRTLVYALRAVSAGQFTAPPVEAEAMYDPNIWARAAGGRVGVRGPWTELVD